MVHTPICKEGVVSGCSGADVGDDTTLLGLIPMLAWLSPLSGTGIPKLKFSFAGEDWKDTNARGSALVFACVRYACVPTYLIGFCTQLCNTTWALHFGRFNKVAETACSLSSEAREEWRRGLHAQRSFMTKVNRKGCVFF